MCIRSFHLFVTVLLFFSISRSVFSSLLPTGAAAKTNESAAAGYKFLTFPSPKGQNTTTGHTTFYS